MKLSLAVAGVSVSILGLCALNLGAATYVVSNTADSGAGSLRQAILDADSSGGGDIDMTGISGAITLATNLPTIAASVNLLGPGTNVLTIDGGSSFSAFSMAAGTTCTLSSLTISNTYSTAPPSDSPTNGLASGVANSGSLKIQDCVFRHCDNGVLVLGGAIYNSGGLEIDGCLIADCLPTDHRTIPYDYGGGIYSISNLTMNGCTITNCSATDGGGISSSSTAVISGCVIEDCWVDGSDGSAGGGIANGGTMTLISCVISNNNGAWDGGGINNNGTLTMDNCVLANNTGEDGGGIYNGGTVTFLNCLIRSNYCQQYGGGGIKNIGGVSLTGCTVSGNQCLSQISDIGGGGIENWGGLSMTNCTISGNVALPWVTSPTTHGGGIQNGPGYGGPGTLVLVDCTVVSNVVTISNNVAGGGIHSSGGTVMLQNTIVANNTSSDFFGVLNSQAHNLIRNTNGCTVTNDATGNIYGVDPLLGPLQYNGGPNPVPTHALLPGSPAIDAGPANAAPFIDQRGNLRPYGPADDIGAFEFYPVPKCSMALSIPAGGGFQVRLTASPGFVYTVQKSLSLSGPWTPLATVDIDSSGTGVCLDPNPSAGQTFYRTVYP